MTDISVCSNLLSLRKKKGYTHMNLSEMTNLSQQYISNVERGIVVPSLRRAIILADALGECCGKVFYIC